MIQNPKQQVKMEETKKTIKPRYRYSLLCKLHALFGGFAILILGINVRWHQHQQQQQKQYQSYDDVTTTGASSSSVSSLSMSQPSSFFEASTSHTFNRLQFRLDRFVTRARDVVLAQAPKVEQDLLALLLNDDKRIVCDGEHDSYSSSSQSRPPPWITANILDYGAIGDNATDNTAAFRAAFDAIRTAVERCGGAGAGGGGGGGEVIVPGPPSKYIFQTSPFNLTSNSILTVEGTVYGVPNQDKFPSWPALPSYGRCADMRGKFRRHPLVHAMNEVNVTIRGSGIVDGGGWYWYPFFQDFNLAHHIGRPHLMELNNCTDVEITGITLKDSAFWTLHPVYCKNVHIHHMSIVAPSCRNYKCANTDGIDIDSSENVLVEHNWIDVGDDHVTVLAGKLRNIPGEPVRSPPTRNVTVQHNRLGAGMGLSIGSSTAGGISDVVYFNNIMRQEKRFQLGQGVHIKLRDRFGGYIRNVAWIDNVFEVAGKPGGAIVFESGYQGNPNWKTCDETNCPEVRDIVIRNLTVHVGNPGRIKCYEQRPCVNITFDNVRFIDDPKARVGCENVASGIVRNSFPPDLFEQCTNLTKVGSQQQ
jgi:polygalacturonase